MNCATSLVSTALPFSYLLRIKNLASDSAVGVSLATSEGTSLNLSAPGAFSFGDPFELSNRVVSCCEFIIISSTTYPIEMLSG